MAVASELEESRAVRPCTLRIRVGKGFQALPGEAFFLKAGGTADNQFIRPGILKIVSRGFLRPGMPYQKRSDHYE